MPDIARGAARILAAARRSLAVEPRGEPDRPLLEAALLFSALYLISFVPSDAAAAGRALSEPRYHCLLLLELLPRSMLVLYLMARAEGLAAFGLRPPRRADLGAGALAALGALGVALLPAWAFSGLGWTNPLLDSACAPGATALLVPLVLASALAIGYGEELFFRVYLIKRLGQAGLPPLWAALASTLAFGSAHGLQGLPGLVVASGLGALFAWRWLKGRNIHEIALGHAFYDAAVMGLAIWGRAGS